MYFSTYHGRLQQAGQGGVCGGSEWNDSGRDLPDYSHPGSRLPAQVYSRHVPASSEHTQGDFYHVRYRRYWIMSREQSCMIRIESEACPSPNLFEMPLWTKCDSRKLKLSLGLCVDTWPVHLDPNFVHLDPRSLHLDALSVVLCDFDVCLFSRLELSI